MATDTRTTGAPARAPSIPDLTRRGLLGAAAIAAPAAAFPLALHVGGAETASASLHSLWKALDAHDAETVRLNRIDSTDEQWDAWGEREGEVFDEVQELPLTPDYAPIRARALATLAFGDPEGIMAHDDSREGYLVRQLVACLLEKH